MRIFTEFKTFAMRGNVVDLAVGVIIGAAFGEIVKSLVDNVLMPPIGYLIGGIDFSNLALALGDANDPKVVLIKYGLFLNSVIKFAIIAFAIFLLVKAINRLSRRTDPPPAEQPADERLLTEIRDLLRQQATQPQPAAASPPPVQG